MATSALRSEHADLARRMRELAVGAAELASDVELLFVTNLRDGSVTDVGPEGVLNVAQHYTRREADEIIRLFRELGVTVHAFFSEREFIAAVTKNELPDSSRQRIVYTVAEGGSGSGRRALIPALCSLMSLPLINSGAHACSLARHKFHANAVLRRVGVRTPETWQFADDAWTGGLAPAGGTRVILKPMWESMCIGIDEDSVVLAEDGFDAIVRETSHRLAQPVLVQEFVSGAEVGISLARIGTTRALPPMAFLQGDGTPFGGRPKTFRDTIIEHNVTYAAYETSEATEIALARDAVRAFDALGMRGVGRIDFRVDLDGRGWVFDTNESPPPVKHTAYASAMAHLGFSLEEMLAVWLGICLLDHGVIS